MDERYERQVTIPEIGVAGQRKLKKGSALVVGAGGLGCPAITTLAEAGVGRIGIVDGDKVDGSNLNRQFLYTPDDLGKSKAACASDWLKKFRPDCQVDTWSEYLTDENAGEILKRFDVILSAVDKVETRLMINRWALKMNIPLIDGALDGFYGTVCAVLGDGGPCLSCIELEGKESLKGAGSIGTTAMVVGALQAQRAIAVIAGIPLHFGHLICYDGIYGTLDEVKIKNNPECPICGSGA